MSLGYVNRHTPTNVKVSLTLLISFSGMTDYLSEESILDYEEEDLGGDLPSGRQADQCYALGCPFTGSPVSLEEHWFKVHVHWLVIRKCPLPQCGKLCMSKGFYQDHLEKFHACGKELLKGLKELPALAESRATVESNLLASLQRRVQEQAEEIRLLRRKLDFDSRQRANPTATPRVMRVADLHPVPLTRPLLCVPEGGLTTSTP